MDTLKNSFSNIKGIEPRIGWNQSRWNMIKISTHLIGYFRHLIISRIHFGCIWLPCTQIVNSWQFHRNISIWLRTSSIIIPLPINKMHSYSICLYRTKEFIVNIYLFHSPTPIHPQWHNFTFLYRPFLMSFHAHTAYRFYRRVMSFLIISFTQSDNTNEFASKKKIEFLYIYWQHPSTCLCDLMIHEYWTVFNANSSVMLKDLSDISKSSCMRVQEWNQVIQI